MKGFRYSVTFGALALRSCFGLMAFVKKELETSTFGLE